MPAKQFAAYVRLVSALVCVGWMLGWSGTALLARTTVPPAVVMFELDVNGLVLVPVALGTGASERCVLDTGSTRSMVSERVKRRLGLAALARAAVVSTGGVATHEVVALPPVTIGEVTRAGLLATVLPDDRMRLLGEAACVIGSDFLSSQDYTIDYRNKTLAWRAETGASDSRSTRIPLVRDEGRYVADLPQTSGRDAVRLVPDSGASDIVIFRDPEPPALSFTPLPGSFGQLAAATGERQVAAVRLQRLRVGSIELRDRPAYLVARSPSEQTWAQGLLPLRLFERVSFHAADGIMVLTPR